MLATMKILGRHQLPSSLGYLKGHSPTTPPSLFLIRNQANLNFPSLRCDPFLLQVEIGLAT